MAVYTKLNEKDINNILSDYSIGKLKSFKGIQEGIENTNYSLLVEDKKYILGYHARVNYEQMEKAHVAFVQVVLSDTRASALENFNREVNKLDSIEQCHMIAGSFDYLLKVRTRNIKDYRMILSEKISSLPNVSSTSTFVSMESVKD